MVRAFDGPLYQPLNFSNDQPAKATYDGLSDNSVYLLRWIRRKCLLRTMKGPLGEKESRNSGVM